MKHPILALAFIALALVAEAPASPAADLDNAAYYLEAAAQNMSKAADYMKRSVIDPDSDYLKRQAAQEFEQAAENMKQAAWSLD